MEQLDESPVQVSKEGVGPERYVCTSEELRGCESTFSGSGHSIPVADRVDATGSVGELKLMVPGKARVVLNLQAVALSVRVVGFLVRAVAGCSTAQDTRVGVCGIVDPNNDTFPVVTVAANNIAGTRLVLGEVPGVHDTELSPVPGGSGIELALVSIPTASANIASILETSTAENVNECLEFECHDALAYLVFPASSTAVYG